MCNDPPLFWMLTFSVLGYRSFNLAQTFIPFAGWQSSAGRLVLIFSRAVTYTCPMSDAMNTHGPDRLRGTRSQHRGNASRCRRVLSPLHVAAHITAPRIRRPAMRFRFAYLLFLAVSFLAATGTPSAHHSWSGYDMEHSVAMKGVVTQFDWSNPHVWISVEVRDDRGGTEKWTAGGPSPSRMSNSGWSQDSLKPGDTITVIGHRLENGSYGMRLTKVILPDGRELICYGGR
jgi:hypothetical protein